MTQNQTARLKQYRKFINERNRALESILDRYRVEISDAVRPALLGLAEDHLRGMARFNNQFSIRAVGSHVQHLVSRMRKNVFLLSLASTGEALSRAKGKKPGTDMITHHNYPEVMMRQMRAGGTVERRVAYYLSELDRKLTSLSELAKLKDETLSLEEIQSVMPKLKPLPHRAELKRLAEAGKKTYHSRSKKAKPPKPDITVDTISEPEWNDILSDYLNKYVPVNRGPDAMQTDEEMLAQGHFPSGRYDDATYDWELENDLTNDFVQTVRNGEMDAANQTGVTDFVVIAVVDNRTCESCCGDVGCVDFDGKTTSEVRKMTGGNYSAPPYHFNCRCSVEPAGSDLPDAPVSNQNEFNDWLNS